jgi:hypothetical protein
VEARFLRALIGFDVQAPTDEDWPRMADLVEEYADFPPRWYGCVGCSNGRTPGD